MAQHRRVTQVNRTRTSRLLATAASGLVVVMVVSGCSSLGLASPNAAGDAAPPSASGEATSKTDPPTTDPSAAAVDDAPASSAGSATVGPAATPAPTPAPVGAFVLSDSIGLSIAPTLSRLGYPVTGRVGQTASTEFLSTHLASDAAQQAPAWVIVLGTNNRGDETDLARLNDWLRTIRTSRSRPRQHVFWVTPHRPAEYDGGMSTHTLDALNAALKQEDAKREWLTVLDFASVAAQNPDWYALDGARLHPDQRGQAALIDLIAGPGAPEADSPAPIVEIARPTPSPAPGDSGGADADFGDMEFTN